MIHQEIAEEIVLNGLDLAYFSLENMESGFLTRQILNNVYQDEIIKTFATTEHILHEMVRQIVHVANGKELTDVECVTLFQYVIDKVVEITYKLVIGQKIDTTFNVTEAFEYHEPDLPYYIQLKLTKHVGKMAIVGIESLDLIDKNGYRTMDSEAWLLPYLLLASLIGMMFAQEIDFDDDSEMQHYLHGK